MGAFARKSNLKFEIVVILSVKMAIVLAAAFFAFGPDQRPRIDGEALNRHILDSASSSKTESPYR